MPPLAPPSRPAAAGESLATALEQRVAALWGLLTHELPGDLSRSAASTLAALRDSGPHRVTSLAERESIAQPSMSQLLQRLERLGLVERHDDPADRRACRIAVTPAGEQALDRRAESRARWLDERLDRLSDADRDALVRALPALDALLTTHGASA
jgi:DNA-binding MarR family transcriptional regulator